jgi:Rrf2 family nitric oxide-sensitive transcriptional repressor
MRITKRTNIAIRLLMFCAFNPDRLVTKTEIAERCNISESHLAQIVNRLGQLGFLHTQRGRTGGVALGRSMRWSATTTRCSRSFQRRLAPNGLDRVRAVY